MALDGFDLIQSYFGDEPESEYIKVGIYLFKLDFAQEYLRPMIRPMFEKIDFDQLDVTYSDENQYYEK